MLTVPFNIKYLADNFEKITKLFSPWSNVSKISDYDGDIYSKCLILFDRYKDNSNLSDICNILEMHE